jgi:Asp-tRNA(Asn)/Glu-tRNA(Gln) amidotransferase A subunit family amidase
MVPLALGTQTAGSVIRPAAWCGVVGYKPTYGLVSRQGVLMQSHTLDTLGVLARTVEDAALAVDVMAGPDAADPATFATSRGSLLALAQSSAPVPPLFALYKSPFWQQADAATREAYGELTEVLGSQVEEIESPLFDQAFEAMLDVMAAENAVHYGPLYDEASAQMSDNLKASIERGRTLTAERYVKAVLLRERANAVLAEHCRNYAAVLTLACAGPAPRADAAFAPNVNGIWTLIGAPAVSLPLMEVDGLPVGVQLVGARRDDGRLLRTARWLATHLATAA